MCCNFSVGVCAGMYVFVCWYACMSLSLCLLLCVGVYLFMCVVVCMLVYVCLRVFVCVLVCLCVSFKSVCVFVSLFLNVCKCV